MGLHSDHTLARSQLNGQVFQQAVGREREKVNAPSTNSTFVRRQALADADIHAGQASPD